jgi:hypothetical protein
MKAKFWRRGSEVLPELLSKWRPDASRIGTAITQRRRAASNAAIAVVARGDGNDSRPLLRYPSGANQLGAMRWKKLPTLL